MINITFSFVFVMLLMMQLVQQLLSLDFVHCLGYISVLQYSHFELRQLLFPGGLALSSITGGIVRRRKYTTGTTIAVATAAAATALFTSTSTTGLMLFFPVFCTSGRLWFHVLFTTLLVGSSS